MQCLHCGRRLSLLRRLSDRAFCSTEHQQTYLQEQESLGLARLLETTRRNESETRRRAERCSVDFGEISTRDEKFFLDVPRALCAPKEAWRSSEPASHRPFIVILSNGLTLPRAAHAPVPVSLLQTPELGPGVLKPGGPPPVAEKAVDSCPHHPEPFLARMAGFKPSLSSYIKLILRPAQPDVYIIASAPPGCATSPALSVVRSPALRRSGPPGPQLANFSAYNWDLRQQPPPCLVSEPVYTSRRSTLAPALKLKLRKASTMTNAGGLELPVVLRPTRAPGPHLPDSRPPLLSVSVVVPGLIPEKPSEKLIRAEPDPGRARFIVLLQPTNTASKFAAAVAEPFAGTMKLPLSSTGNRGRCVPLGGWVSPLLEGISGTICPAASWPLEMVRRSRPPAVAARPAQRQPSHAGPVALGIEALDLRPSFADVAPTSVPGRRIAVCHTAPLPSCLKERSELLRFLTGPVSPPSPDARTVAMSVLPAPTAPRLPANAFRVGAKRKLDISAGAPHLSLPPYELAGAASATPFSVHSPQPEIRIDCVAPRVQSPCAAPAGLSWEPLSLDVEKIAVKEGKSCRVAVQGPSAMLPGTRIPRLRVHPSLGPPTASVDPPLKPFWQKAWPLPRPVRWAALPLVLLAVFMVVRPGSGPAAQRPARAAVVPTPASISNWEAFRSTIADRASIRLVEDFRSGLADWEGSGNWAKTWSYDAAGFVRPGQLAIYNPSRNMKDYAFEFSAAIDQGGVGWVCRASDPKNFYAARLVISDPGPMQRLALIRYPVVKGKAGTRQRIVLPFLMRTRSMQHVRMEVRGSSFTVYVDGQLVEHWTHDQLQSGGIGFFGDSGDQFRLRWASVTHQYDLLGRLCALLAPSPGDFDSRSD